MGFPGSSEVKNLPAKPNAEATGAVVSIPVLGKSPGEGNGNSLQCSRWRFSWTEEPGGVAESNMTEHTHAHADINYRPSYY